jgi:uncharacterized protein
VGQSTPKFLLHRALVADFQAIADLNAGEVQHTSAMTIEQLRDLDALADRHLVAEVNGEVVAFVIAIREQRPYQNDNYRWFSSRYSTFLYIDRIVVDPRFTRLGIGAGLYDDVFRHARLAGIPLIACEYNITPVNASSRAFHDRFGFREVGTQRVANGAKQVSLQIADA